MFFSKAIIALTAAAVAVATPLARDTQCKLTVTPAHSADITALRASFNNAVSHAVEAHWPLGLDNTITVLNAENGGYAGWGVVTVAGVSDADVAAFFNSLKGTTIDGGDNQFKVTNVAC